jgi:hypothetical protein
MRIVPCEYFRSAAFGQKPVIVNNEIRRMKRISGYALQRHAFAYRQINNDARYEISDYVVAILPNGAAISACVGDEPPFPVCGKNIAWKVPSPFDR